MKKITLTPEMSKREFEAVTGMRVLYRDKGKTGVSFKVAGLCHTTEDQANLRAENFMTRFDGCKVKVMRAAVPSYMTKKLWNVRVVLPLAK